jgi:hypothetical protein
MSDARKARLAIFLTVFSVSPVAIRETSREER